MNNKSKLDPLGSLMEQKNKGRTRVKIAIFFVLAIHGVGLLALLVQGCHKDDTGPKSTTEAANANNTGGPMDSNAQVAPTETNPPAGTTAAPPMPPQPPQTAETGTAPSTIGGTEYTIAKGDTFSSIASHYHVTVSAIKEANPGVDPTKLQIGKKLHIPPQPIPGTASPAGNETALKETTANGEKIYTVKSGDTLTTIARANSTSVKAIRGANPSLTTDRIVVGQKLKIPVKVVETAASSTPTR